MFLGTGTNFHPHFQFCDPKYFFSASEKRSAFFFRNLLAIEKVTSAHFRKVKYIRQFHSKYFKKKLFLSQKLYCFDF